MRILHVDVGGSYGGSLRALENYLAYSDRSRFVHDLLLYYPTPRTERLKHLVERLWALYEARPPWLVNPPKAAGRVRAVLKTSMWGPALVELRNWVGLVQSLPTALRVRRVLRTGEYDLVHVNNTFTYQVPTLLAAWWAGIPVVAHARSIAPAGAFARTMMRLADCVATVNRSLEKELDAWGLRVIVRTCYCSLEAPAPDEAVSSALRESLVPSRGILIGSVGRLSAEKGYHNLIQAARRVADLRPEVRFAIAGEGQLRLSLEKLIAQLELSDRFHLCGFRADVANFLAALDLFVSSSLWEGSPLAIAEAMLLGKPVIATSVGGNAELIVPGRTGVLVPPSDPNALASALLAALADREALERFAREGRQVATEIANPSANARKFEELVEYAAIRKRAPTREFYERAYSTPGWGRIEESKPSSGARFVKMWYRALLDHVMPRVPLKGKRVLEVGSGYGYLAPYLCASGAEFFGVDVAFSAVSQFPRPSGLKCHPAVADGIRLPFPNDSFDVIICMEVLEHVPDPTPLLDECFRVVRPSGQLIFSCPNYCNLFIFPKLLSRLGVPFLRRLMRHQVVDRFTTSFGLRRVLARRGTVLLQRGVRLHPPFFEQAEYRLGATSVLRRVNDWIFAVEKRWGGRPPLSYLGLHTVCLVSADRKMAS